MESFTDLSTAAYCPRQLYYRRRNDDYEIPEEIEAIRELAGRYESLLDPTTDLRDEPIAVTPTQYRSNLGCVKARLDCWEGLVDPPRRQITLEGKECRGVVEKLLEAGPSIVSAGEPPPEGVWEPQSVRATAAAKALAWQRQTPVERAFVEYPACGVVRELRVTTRRKAQYRRALRAARSIDGPPPRLRDDARCEPCEYRTECGTKTRSLRSLL